MPPPRVLARAAGALYLVTIIAGTCSFLLGPRGLAANLLAGLAYVGVTALLYFIFEPVSRALSLTAALVSLAGCAIGALTAAQLIRFPLSPLALFGVYCLLLAALIRRSTLLPQFLAVLMAIGGIGWLTFAVPKLSSALVPFNMLPGFIAETTLALWLLIKGTSR